jgi:glucose/arabinose dehydrogenase
MRQYFLAAGLMCLLSASLAAQTPIPSFNPAWRTVEGQPIETRPPEKADDEPLFPEQTRAPYHKTASFKTTVLTDKLYAPWNLALLPDGNILITERLPGTIRMLGKDGVLSAPFTGLAGLTTMQDIGMLDVALDPHFVSNHRIFFAFFEYDGKTDSNTYVGKGILDESAHAVTGAQVIFRSIPAWPSMRLGGKTGGRIVFDPGGNLILPIGDRSDSPPWDVAQRMSVHLGKIIRITPDGKPAPGNPFAKTPGALPEIWALGTRSQEGLAIDPATGKVWETEHGPRGGDELNIIQKGKNYGWPLITHGIDYPGGPIGAGITAKDGLEQPVYYWDPVIAPSGLAFYQGSLFPQWHHSLFAGGLRGMLLDRLEISHDKVVAEEPLLTELHSRIRDVRVGPDGAVYVLTDSGGSAISAHTPATAKLLKLTPQ